MSIIKQSIQTTTGNQDNVAQSFAQNIFFTTSEGVITPFIFDTPQFTTVGGTRDYYGQNPLAIFTNLVLPFIRFNFTANTESFGPDVYIKHDFYRVKWDTFGAVQSGLQTENNESIQTENYTEERVDEVDENGVLRTKITRRTTNEVNNTIKSSRKSSDMPSGMGTRQVVPPTIADIQSQLNTPQFTITASTSGITTSVYDLQLDQFTKNLGEYKTELFQDRDQYIVDTNFIFNRTATGGLTNLENVTNIDGGGISVSSGIYNSTTQTETTTPRQTVDGGDFKGLSFPGGEYFSFFQVPDKPTFEYPTPSGQLDTFTPAIYWSNAEKADSYMVQVNYNTGDTGFTGTVYTYVVDKTDEFKKEIRSRSKTPDSESETTKEIRTYQLSLKSNKTLLYRVGNVKEISNLFGVKQKVVTFSDNKEVSTQTEPIRTFVFVEDDSPYQSDIAGLKTPPSLDAESPLSEYTLSGTVTGSIVSGATMQLIYPNASFVTVPTDSVGGFEFNELEEGTYTLNTTYRGYGADSRSIVMSADTNVSIEVQINWDNIYDLVATKENDIIKY